MTADGSLTSATFDLSSAASCRVKHLSLGDRAFLDVVGRHGDHRDIAKRFGFLEVNQVPMCTRSNAPWQRTMRKSGSRSRSGRNSSMVRIFAG